MAHEVTLILGDGVGPELAEAAKMCVEATGVAINWDEQEAGVDVMAKLGTPMPDSVIESCRRTKVALKAPVTTPVGTGFRSVNVYLRQALDLYGFDAAIGGDLVSGDQITCPGFYRAERAAFNARDLHITCDRVASHAEVVLEGRLGGVLKDLR